MEEDVVAEDEMEDDDVKDDEVEEEEDNDGENGGVEAKNRFQDLDLLCVAPFPFGVE